jgi:hypothetical protein
MQCPLELAKRLLLGISLKGGLSILTQCSTRTAQRSSPVPPKKPVGKAGATMPATKPKRDTEVVRKERGTKDEEPPEEDAREPYVF